METRTANRWLEYPVYLLTLVLPFVLLEWISPLTGDHTIGNDYPMFSITQQMELQYSLEHGTWPLYIPGFAGGRAAAALTLGQLYHPQSHLAAQIPGYWDGDALRHNTLLRLVSLGLCHLLLFLLMRRLGLSITAAFLVSLVTVYNLRMLDTFRFGASLESYTAHLYLCAAMAFYYLKPTRVRGPLLIVGATYLLVCGGHPQFMYYCFIACAIIGLTLPLALYAIAPQITLEKKRIIRFYVVATLCAITGILLSAAYLVPLYFDFVLDTGQRINQGYSWAIGYTDSWGGALNNIFHPLHVSLEACFGGSTIIVLPFIVPLAYAMKVKVPKVVLFFAGFMVFLLLLSLARNLPLYHWYWEYFPLARSYRIPGRLLIMMPVIILFTLAFVFNRLDSNVSFRGRELPLTGLSALAIVGSLLYLVYHFTIFPNAPRAGHPYLAGIRDIPDWAVSLVTWSGLVTLMLAIVYGLKTRLKMVAGPLLTLAVLLQLGAMMYFGTWITHDRTTPTLKKMDADKAKELSFRAQPGNNMWSNYVKKQMDNAYLEKDMGKFYRKWIDLPNARNMFNALGQLRLPDHIVVAGRKRFWKPSENQVQKTGLDIVSLKRGTFNQAIFSADTHAEGFFNFTYIDPYHWKAFIDGKPAKLYRANGYEQALFMPSGKHEIEFRFVSAASTVGMIVSLITLAGLLIHVCLASARSPVKFFLALGSVSIPLMLFLWWQSSIIGGDHLGTRYRWTNNLFPPQNNLAFGKNAKMSSIENYQYPMDHYAGIGIDGKRTGARVETDHKHKNHWWQVDLGKKYKIGEIVIYDGTIRRTNRNFPLQILLSQKGDTFKKAETVNKRGKDHPFRILLNGRKARFVRVQSSTQNQLSFHEVEIYELKHPVKM